MKNFKRNSVFVILLLVGSMFSLKKINANPGDVGISMFGTHVSRFCLYHITNGEVTVTVGVKKAPTLIMYTDYGAIIEGEADTCQGWDGGCWANGKCFPKSS